MWVFLLAADYWAITLESRAGEIYITGHAIIHNITPNNMSFVVIVETLQLISRLGLPEVVLPNILIRQLRNALSSSTQFPQSFRGFLISCSLFDHSFSVLPIVTSEV